MPNGSLDALPEAMFLGGLTVHATPQLDVYVNGGGDKILSANYFRPVTPAMAPRLASTTPAATPSSALRRGHKDVWEVTGGFWDKIYEGAFGSLRVGLQYAYIKRDFEPGRLLSCQAAAITGAGPLVGGSTNEQAAYFSVRYYPFDPAPAAPIVSKY